MFDVGGWGGGISRNNIIITLIKIIMLRYMHLCSYTRIQWSIELHVQWWSKVWNQPIEEAITK